MFAALLDNAEQFSNVVVVAVYPPTRGVEEFHLPHTMSCEVIARIFPISQMCSYSSLWC